MNKIKVGVIGLGYWGPNYVRNFHRHSNSEVKWACDLSEDFLKKIKHDYPLTQVTNNFKDLLGDGELDLIAIATPPKSHFQIGSLALKAGKHIILAKPLTTNLKDGKKLLQIARQRKLLMHSDLTYLYGHPINKIKELVDNKLLGQPVFFDSTRANAGPIRDDANVIWDLAPHDLSILDYLFKIQPKSVLATGAKHYRKSTTEEIAHIVLKYPNNFMAHIHLSWLSPVKIRAMVISGEKRMIYFNDSEPEEKIRIYNSQIIDVKEKTSARKLFYNNGDITIPHLKSGEALFMEIDQIINQLLKNKINYDNGELSVRIIKILDACDKSLKENRVVFL